MNTELNKRVSKVMDEMDVVQNKQQEVEKQKTELQDTVSTGYICNTKFIKHYRAADGGQPAVIRERSLS